MAQLLRQGTSVAVHIGPALTTGGLAVQTAITTTGTAKRIIKHLATAAVTVTGSITHISVGHYRITLGTGHTGTLGHLTLAITATAGTNKALPMWQRYMVVPSNVFDSLVSGSDRLDVNAAQWAGAATATGDIAVQNSLTDKAGFSLVTGQHDSIGTRVWAVTARTLTSGATVASSVWVATTRTLTSAGVAWTAGTRTLTSGGAVSDSVWVETARTLTSAGVTWSAAARTLTSGGAVSDSVWVETVRTLTSAGVVWTAGTRSLTDKAGFALTSGQHDSIGTRVWAVTTRTLTTFGFKTGYALTSGQHDTIATRVWANTARTLTSGSVVWSVAARTLTSGGNVASSVWGRAQSELTAVPAATPAAGQALMFLYMGARNKHITTATGDKLHSSASIGFAKAPLSASSTIFTKGQYLTVTG